MKEMRAVREEMEEESESVSESNKKKVVISELVR